MEPNTEYRRPLRRTDSWTLQALSPISSRNGSALSNLVARQAPDPKNGSNPMTSTIRRVLRRLDNWTMTVFNPYYPSDHRR